jgi:hypothetical protein
MVATCESHHDTKRVYWPKANLHTICPMSTIHWNMIRDDDNTARMRILYVSCQQRLEKNAYCYYSTTEMYCTVHARASYTNITSLASSGCFSEIHHIVQRASRMVALFSLPPTTRHRYIGVLELR